MIVTRCRECPFFRPSLTATLGHTDRGFCHYDTDSRCLSDDSQVRMNRRLPVLDRNLTPRECPLRAGDIVITLKVTN